MKKTIFLGFGLLMLAACGGKDNVTLKDQLVIEYGAELKVEDLTEQEGISLKEVKEYDAKKIGEQKVIAIFTDVDEKEIEQEITLEVKDTQAPEITFKSETVEITLGDSFDASSNLESVKDPIDGDITQSNDNTITENGYFFGGDPISSEVGEYTITVTAFDKNGNKSEKNYRPIIKEKQAESDDQQVASNQGGSQTQAPSNNNSGSTNNNGGSQTNSGNSSGSTAIPPKKVCSNGNEPLDPNLPCDAWHPIGLDQCYRDASGNIVAFPSSKTAANWAKEVMTNDRSFDIYSTFVTAPIAKNDGTEYYGVTFMK